MADQAVQAPLYRHIRKDLEDRILSGAWPPGTRIPSEDELTRQFGCSRMTVNKALSALAHAGLVIRKRKAGTVVARPPQRHPLLELRDLRAEISDAGSSPRHEILDREIRAARHDEAARLALGDGEDLLALTVLHRADETPVLLEERLIGLGAVPEAAEVNFTGVPPGSWLLEQVTWTSAEHRIRAARADAPTARRLELEPGEACLVIERRTFRQDVPITWARLTYPGDQHELYGSFRPAETV